jgi:PAS domain S-box-containing protein
VSKDRRQVEALMKTNLALEEKISLYRAALDNLTDMVFLKDEAFRPILVNRSVLRFCGKGEQEVIGRTAREFLPGAMANASRLSDAEVMATGRTVVTERTVGERIFESTQSPVPLSGNRTGIGCCIRDVT